MPTTRTIEIDFDLHQKIESERNSFDESPNDVLKKLLGLPVGNDIDRSAPTVGSSGRAWSADGVTLPHATNLKMEYNGILYEGFIDNGAWSIEGVPCNGPSDAASSVARTRKGMKTQLNGWIYWEAMLPGTKSWVAINEMRLEARER